MIPSLKDKKKQISPKCDIIYFPQKNIGEDICMESLYQSAGTIKRLKEYFQPYLHQLTKPSGAKFFLLLLSILSMQFITSLRNTYRWFLSGICGASLNSYWNQRHCSGVHVDNGNLHYFGTQKSQVQR